MLSPRTDQYLNDILYYIKLPFDRETIRMELEDHIAEKIDYYFYTLKVVDKETAEQLALKDMGDAEEIGLALNKQHNPLIGWIWKITNIMVALLIILLIFLVGSTFALSLFRDNKIEDVPKSYIDYRIDIKKTVRLDDTIINFTNVIYDKDGDINIYYEYYDTKLWGSGWSLFDIIEIRDNMGNQYNASTSSSTGGIKSYCIASFDDFSSEADTLIIDYNHYDRTFTVEIPLKEGEK